MATESELRRKLADERRELTEAVTSLREQLGQTAERGKKLGTALGAGMGVVLAARTVLRLRRRRRD